MQTYVAYHFQRLDRAAVTKFVEYNEGKLLGEYVDRAKKWPHLVEAIAKCQETGAALIIAEVGRFAHNAKFLSLLMESGVDFVCLDFEKCNRYTIAILVATAEEEAAKTSQRLREGMAAAKAKGMKLGSARPGHWEGREHRRGTKQAIAASAKMRRITHRQAYEFLLPDLKRLRLEGKTMDEIAVWLNSHGHLTTTGGPFNQVSVHRLLKRYLGDDFLGKTKDRGGNPQIIKAMERTT